MKIFSPQEWFVVVDKFATGRRVEFITNSKAIDLLRFITSSSLSTAGGIPIREIPQILSLLGDTNKLTTNLVAQLYGDPAKREKTPRILTSAQVKDIVDTELDKEDPARRLAMAALIVYIMNKQGLIDEKKSLAIDAIFPNLLEINFNEFEDDIVLVVMAEAIERAYDSKMKLRMTNVVTLAESIREIFRTYTQAVNSSVKRAPYLNTLYSLVAKDSRQELQDIYLNSAAFESARRLANFYIEPSKFKEIPFEYSTVHEYDKLLTAYLGNPNARFNVMSLTELSAMFNVERFIHANIRELFGIIVQRNITPSDERSSLVSYFQHGNLYIYTPIKDDHLNLVERAIITEDASIIRKLLSTTHNLRMELEPDNRTLITNISLGVNELKYLALALSDSIVVTYNTKEGISKAAIRVEFNTNKSINQDIYSELLKGMNGLKHTDKDLLTGKELFFGGDEERLSTNSILFTILFSQKNGGIKSYRTKTESVEEFINRSIFINMKHTSTLAEKVVDIPLVFMDDKGVRQVLTVGKSPAELVSGISQLEFVAALSNVRNQIVNAQDRIHLESLLAIVTDRNLSEPTRRALTRQVQKNVIDSLRKLNTIPWIKTLASTILMEYKIPMSRKQLLHLYYNRLSATATAYAIMYKFITARESILFELVNSYLVVDSSILSNLDPQDIII